MLHLEIGFNALLLGLDLAALGLVRKNRRFTSLALMGWSIASFMVAVTLAGGVPFMRAFFVARLGAYAIFLHGPLCWLGLAWILRAGASSSQREASSLGSSDSASSPWVARCAAGIGLLLALIGVDAFLVEPTWLEVRRVEIRSARVAAPLRIVVLADLQTDSIGDYERSVLARIKAEKPDLVLLAGDYLQCWDGESQAREVGAFQVALREAEIQARWGIYAVRGDCEGRDWEKIFAGTGVKPLRGVAQLHSGLRLQGLSLGESHRGAPALPATEQLRVVFGHRPDFALEPVEADLLIAGHTHGGQVQLPLIGPLVTLSGVPRAWAGGEPTKLPSGATLVVSRGVGMERATAPRLRFLCRPELVVIEVLPSR